MPAGCAVDSRRARPRVVVDIVWYYVRDLDAARRFYASKLGFTEASRDEVEGWVKLERGRTKIGLAQGEPQSEGAVAHVDVDDVKAVAERLRSEGVEVGVVFELHGEMRLLDVHDPDGNRLQFAEDVSG
ncbi:MAG: VOC family protein [Actinobacteria bacterium]|nr:MAG: VOC family protein [Actinomycetota bacterium]